MVLPWLSVLWTVLQQFSAVLFATWSVKVLSVGNSCKGKLVSEIMKIIHEREMYKKNKQTHTHTKKNKDRKWQGEAEAIVKGWEQNDFVVHLNYVSSI